MASPLIRFHLSPLPISARQEFAVEQWRRDIVQWLKRSLPTRDGLERYKAANRYTARIQATVYRVAKP